MPTSVYQLFDANDEVIYVGASSNVDNRVAIHRRRAWGHQIDSYAVVWTGPRKRAFEREAMLISEMRPRYNRAHNPDYELAPIPRRAPVDTPESVRCLRYDHTRGEYTILV